MTFWQKESTPLFSRLPSSQKAFRSFFCTALGESRMSILEAASEELIFWPVSPGTMGFIRCARFL